MKKIYIPYADGTVSGMKLYENADSVRTWVGLKLFIPGGVNQPYTGDCQLPH